MALMADIEDHSERNHRSEWVKLIAVNGLRLWTVVKAEVIRRKALNVSICEVYHIIRRKRHKVLFLGDETQKQNANRPQSSVNEGSEDVIFGRDSMAMNGIPMCETDLSLITLLKVVKFNSRFKWLNSGVFYDRFTSGNGSEISIIDQKRKHNLEWNQYKFIRGSN